MLLFVRCLMLFPLFGRILSCAECGSWCPFSFGGRHVGRGCGWWLMCFGCVISVCVFVCFPQCHRLLCSL